MNQIRRVIVFGAGAIGGVVGALLAESGREVTLIVRGAHGRAIRDQGLRLRRPGSDRRYRLPVAEGPSGIDFRPGDLVLLAVKLNDAEAALDDLLAAAGTDLPVLCAQNGVAGERWAKERFRCVLGAVVWLPSGHIEPGEVCAYRDPEVGRLDLGAATEAARPWLAPAAEALDVPGLCVEAVQDVMPLKYAKLITNLGNVAQVLYPDPAEARRAAAEASSEATAVLRAAGIDFVDVAAFVAARARPLGEIEGVPRGGGSTWQSFQRGRPLETPYLNGEIVRIAKSAGVDAPVNRRLLEAALRLSVEPA